MALRRDAVLATAEKLLAKGKYDGALKEYLRLLEENPNDILVLNKVGDIYVLLNRPTDSLPHFTRIAEHYARDGFFLKAIAIYKKINKIDPAKLEIYNYLGELYHKQGLLPEARAQYQILADHHLKLNQLPEAIAVYRKMAAADPNDIKIPVRLADLLITAGEPDQALMQYGVIGSMLVKRGAIEEAVAVYQKALKIRPGDRKVLHDLVRSMLDGGNAEAAVLLLQSQPRDADTMMLLAEALLSTKNTEDARKAAEAAIAFDHGNEAARQFLSRLRAGEKDFAGSFEALLPLVDQAVRAGSVRKAIGMLLPLANPPFPALQEKLLELYRIGGDGPKVVETLGALARVAWDAGDRAGASMRYREILELEPDNAEARSRAGLASPAPAPAPAEEEGELVVEFDESLLSEPPELPLPSVSAAPPASAAEPPARPRPVPGAPAAPAGDAVPLENTAVRRARAEEAEWKDAVTEAEVFAKYGLVEKAAEKYRAMLRRRPRELSARRRFVELLSEMRSPALPAEAATLVDALRESGQDLEAEATRSRYLPGSSAAQAAPAAFELSAPSGAPPDFDDLALPPSAAFPAALSPRSVTASPALSESASPALSESASPALSESASPALSESASPALSGNASPAISAPQGSRISDTVDMEFAFDAGLGKALDDEMAKFQKAEPEPPPAPPAFDEMSLFSDEQRFFNLAAELEKELEDEEAPEAPLLEGGGEEVSLEEIFREFKRGVEQQLSPEDYETHYNLGIAYKEMGLTDEAIGEFQIASKDPARAVECCSMLGLCFLEKGLAPLALQWFRKGLDSPAIREEERWGLQYDVAGVLEQTGDAAGAYDAYLAIYGENSNYRDVAARVKALESTSGR